MSSTSAFSKERIERAARIYNSLQDAGRALGIAPGSFARLCKRHNVENPTQRRRRKQREHNTRRDD